MNETVETRAGAGPETRAQASEAARAAFRAPGPGSWELETTHCTRPLTRFIREPYARAFPAGMAEGTARYGLLLSHFQPAHVEGFLVVLPLLGAIVTDRGGQLCHAAIVSREYGIPGVVGTREATRLIKDGDRVRVDGAAGTVEVLA